MGKKHPKKQKENNNNKNVRALTPQNK